MAIKERADHGERLSERDTDFLEEMLADANRITPLVDRHPEWQPLAAQATIGRANRAVSQWPRAFLDADDLWHADKLSRQMARFDSRPDLQMCSTGIKNFREPELKHLEEQFRDHRFMQPHPGFTTQALLARRGVFDLIGDVDESIRIGEDIDWFSRARDQGIELDFLDEVLVYRRWHQNNLTQGFYTEGKKDLLQVIINKMQRDRQQPQ